MLLKRMTALSEFLRKRVKSESGVTMIETLVVILMMANLMAIALPSFVGHTDKF